MPAFWLSTSPQKWPVDPAPQLAYWIGVLSLRDSAINSLRLLAGYWLAAIMTIDELPIAPRLWKSRTGSYGSFV
ncbi:hypothetical protein D3C87_1997220 [compost metagenome]